MVTPESGEVAITRVTELGVDSIRAKLPAVISVVEKVNEPRYPSFKGIMSAKKKVMEIRDLAAVGVDAATVGTTGAWSVVDDAVARPPRSAGIKIVDDGSAGNSLVEFLVEKKLI